MLDRTLLHTLVRRLTCAITSLFLSTAPIWASPGPTSSESCTRVKLLNRLPLIVSIAWKTGSNQPSLLATSFTLDRVIELNAHGDALTRIQGKGDFWHPPDPNNPNKAASEPPVIVRPSLLRALPQGGYLLEDEKLMRGVGDDEIFRLDENFNIAGDRLVLKGSRLANEGELVTVFDWQPFSNGILAYGDVRHGSSRPQGTLFYLGRGPTGQLESEVYLEIDAESAEAKFYELSTQFIAVDGDTGYMLRQTDIPELVEVQRHQHRPRRRIPLMVGFPSTTAAGVDLLKGPDTPDGKQMTPRERLMDRYRKFERGRFLTGLVAWEGRLYLLAKEPVGGGNAGNSWMLLGANRSALSAQAVNPFETLRLPSTSPNLRIVPGETWAFIESTAATWSGSDVRIDATQVVTLPGAWLANATTSPLRSPSSLPSCDAPEH